MTHDILWERPSVQRLPERTLSLQSGTVSMPVTDVTNLRFWRCMRAITTRHSPGPAFSFLAEMPPPLTFSFLPPSSAAPSSPNVVFASIFANTSGVTASGQLAKIHGKSFSNVSLNSQNSAGMPELGWYTTLTGEE